MKTPSIYQLALLRTTYFPFQLSRMLISTDQVTVPLSDIPCWTEAPNTIVLWYRLFKQQCIHEPENKAQMSEIKRHTMI